jgi:plasmid stabilization system protein ParE
VRARVTLRRTAERDIENILEWYLDNAPEHSHGFVETLGEAVDRVRDSPRLFRTVYGEVRRAALRRFPYFLWFIYFDEAEIVQVLAVTHQSRDPDQSRP